VFKEYPDIMTPAEVAQALHIGMNSVYRLLQTHELGSKKIGRKYIVPKACVIAYVQSARYTVTHL